jgi:hypothetical protein
VISRACYVECDLCGDPAPVACVEGVSEARQLAANDGYRRVDDKDVCGRCRAALREASDE